MFVRGCGSIHTSDITKTLPNRYIPDLERNDSRPEPKEFIHLFLALPNEGTQTPERITIIAERDYTDGPKRGPTNIASKGARSTWFPTGCQITSTTITVLYSPSAVPFHFTSPDHISLRAREHSAFLRLGIKQVPRMCMDRWIDCTHFLLLGGLVWNVDFDFNISHQLWNPSKPQTRRHCTSFHCQMLIGELERVPMHRLTIGIMDSRGELGWGRIEKLYIFVGLKMKMMMVLH